jgi:ribosomal protein S17E
LLDEIKNPNLIDPEYLNKFIALYHSKSKELFHEQFKKQEEQEQESEREKKILQKIAGLIIEAQQALKEGNLPELARVLEEMEKHCDTSDYADNKQVITNLKEQLSKLISDQTFISPDKPVNYHVIVLLLASGVLILIFLAKFLQLKKWLSLTLL